MRKTFVYSLLLAFSLGTHAQDTTAVKADSTARHSVAIFLPLYLDSAFDADGELPLRQKFSQNSSIRGWNFMKEVFLSLDSLRKEGMRLDLHIYDTRSATRPIQQVLADSSFDMFG